MGLANLLKQTDLKNRDIDPDCILPDEDGSPLVYKWNHTITYHNLLGQGIGMWLWRFSLDGNFENPANAAELTKVIQNYFSQDEINVKHVGRVIKCCQDKKVTYQDTRTGATFYKWKSATDLANSMFLFYRSWYRHPAVVRWNNDCIVGEDNKADVDAELLQLTFEEVVDGYYTVRREQKKIFHQENMRSGRGQD